MARAPCKEEICRHLCHHASYQEDIDNLVVQAKAEPASGSVLLTWPPTAGGEGFSAFMTKIDTGGELANALIVVFRGTHSPGEWARYPGGFFRGPSEMDGLSVFPPWVKTLEQIWDKPGNLPDNSKSTSTQAMKDIVVSALQNGLEVCLTGHSMGGAVAHTAAALLLCGNENRQHNLGNKLSGLSVMTFNSPRALKCAKGYNEALETCEVQHERMDNGRDLVRHMPPGYEHGGKAVVSGRGLGGNPVLKVVGVVVAVAVVPVIVIL